MPTVTIQEPILSSDRLRPIAKKSSHRLAPYIDQDLEVSVPNEKESITLPREAVRMLVDLLAHLAQGNAVTIVPFHAELTTKQAAEFLGVSRPFVVKLLENQELDYTKVGTHRRIRFDDLLGYKNEKMQKRRKVLDELAEIAQDNGTGY